MRSNRDQVVGVRGSIDGHPIPRPSCGLAVVPLVSGGIFRGDLEGGGFCHVHGCVSRLDGDDRFISDGQSDGVGVEASAVILQQAAELVAIMRCDRSQVIVGRCSAILHRNPGI